MIILSQAKFIFGLCIGTKQCIAQRVLTLSNRKNQFDFLIATATKPQPNNRLLTMEDIANGVKFDKDRKYFINNIVNGIITQEDFEISKRL